ncbi:unnamed protein product [Ceratitis capitata]|uniref:(Mediterranean fruit fly) hypothetical protein n=1 Tax=Ceratitis capitata TaxID=7213 RepID=A0A811UBQ6_CERCA|nr:unnamed protein product [Ceratitis capitata]
MSYRVSQDDHKAFRRQLEDKRPIVESNLLSGRQYISSEPPVSDNSDTEVFSTIGDSFRILMLLISHPGAYVPSHDSDSRYLSAEEQSRELTRSIRREVAKLSEQWNNLIDRSDNWKHRLDEYMTVYYFKKLPHLPMFLIVQPHLGLRLSIIEVKFFH